MAMELKINKSETSAKRITDLGHREIFLYDGDVFMRINEYGRDDKNPCVNLTTGRYAYFSSGTSITAVAKSAVLNVEF